tara:strand:+ start:318 stop:509 length:192 start_codon:yes stop_codon:yes gene_type:complete
MDKTEILNKVRHALENKYSIIVSTEMGQMTYPLYPNDHDSITFQHIKHSIEKFNKIKVDIVIG